MQLEWMKKYLKSTCLRWTTVYQTKFTSANGKDDKQTDPSSTISYMICWMPLQTKLKSRPTDIFGMQIKWTVVKPNPNVRGVCSHPNACMPSDFIFPLHVRLCSHKNLPDYPVLSSGIGTFLLFGRIGIYVHSSPSAILSRVGESTYACPLMIWVCSLTGPDYFSY